MIGESGHLSPHSAEEPYHLGAVEPQVASVGAGPTQLPLTNPVVNRLEIDLHHPGNVSRSDAGRRRGSEQILHRRPSCQTCSGARITPRGERASISWTNSRPACLQWAPLGGSLATGRAQSRGDWKPNGAAVFLDAVRARLDPPVSFGHPFAATRLPEEGARLGHRSRDAQVRTRKAQGEPA